jgi:hypothetical protein
MKMTQPLNRNVLTTSAVLAVGRERVEWFDRDASGTLFHGVAQPAGSSAADLASAAEEAWRASGGRRRRCVLAVDDTLSRQQLLVTPRLSRRELAGVFERKAARLIDLDKQDVLYLSVPMGEESEEPDADPQLHWCLVAMNGALLRPLRVHLRSRGFRVSHVVSRSMAALCRAQQECPRPEEAAIVVAVDRNSVTVGLTHGPELVYRDRFDGDIREEPTLATSLVQVIRSCSAFWKKRSRGGDVRQVVLLGLPPQQGHLLSHVITPLVTDGEVVVLPGEGEGREVGQHEYLAAANCPGPLNPDLSFPLPTQKILVSVLLAILCLVSGTLGWILLDSVSTELRAIEADTGGLEFQAASLVPFRAANHGVATDAIRLERHLDRTAAIGSAGLPLEDLLIAVTRTFDGRATLEEIALQPSEWSGGNTITVHGHADPRPERVLQTLRELTAILESSPLFEEVLLHLPDRFPEAGDRSDSGRFDFSIEATVSDPTEDPAPERR